MKRPPPNPIRPASGTLNVAEIRFGDVYVTTNGRIVAELYLLGGIYHAALQVADIDHLADAAKRLLDSHAASQRLN